MAGFLMRDAHRRSEVLVFWAAVGAMMLVLPGTASSVLSPAQEKVVAEKTAKLSPAEKAEIASWPDSKKLTEFFCAPVGLKEIQKAEKRANRLILGPDDAGIARFVVEANRKVSGRGMVRLIGEWRDLSFECTLDPEKGTAAAFTYKLDPK